MVMLYAVVTKLVLLNIRKLGELPKNRPIGKMEEACSERIFPCKRGEKKKVFPTGS